MGITKDKPLFFPCSQGWWNNLWRAGIHNPWVWAACKSSLPLWLGILQGATWTALFLLTLVTPTRNVFTQQEGSTWASQQLHSRRKQTLLGPDIGIFSGEMTWRCVFVSWLQREIRVTTPQRSLVMSRMNTYKVEMGFQGQSAVSLCPLQQHQFGACRCSLWLSMERRTVNDKQTKLQYSPPVGSNPQTCVG